jgi:PAS domain S-box-containing protein
MTAHAQAQSLLRISERRYHDLMEALPVALIQTDASLRVVYANPALYALTGFKASEIAEPAAWWKLIHPDDLPRIQALAATSLAGHSGRAPYRYQARDGSEKVGLAIIQPRRQATRSGEEVIGITILIVDQTHERRLEQELERTQRLELAGRLSCGIAHDFNNLLTSILNSLDLAREGLAAGNPVGKDLEGIVAAGQRASDLAGQLLNLGKRRPASSQRIEVNKVVRQTLELLRASLPPGIKLRPDLAGGELCIVGDETQVQQVVINLCLNARDAMPQGGQLTIRTRVGPSSTVRLTVEDEGEGMAEYTRAHLFDPFFSTKERGMGLGLMMVHQIVTGGGGRIEVASQPGQGTRFEVSWPAAAGELDPATCASISPGA